MAAGKTKSLYSVHPGVAMMQKWIDTLPEKTGRSMDEWLQFIKKNGPQDEKQCRAWLKEEFKVGTNTAWWLAERAQGRGWEEDSPESYLQQAEIYVEEMFAGAKAGLRPIYDALLQLGLSIGKDVKACPGKTIVPLYRNHVFAQLKPSTRTRIDLGLALGNMAVPDRLIDTGGFAKKDRITHRIPISALEEIDDEVRHWLKVAYDLDA
ncbi:MAG: DUF4287 domain-containing protein [Acidobacteria bacterium]|nr:DUF4287 domain-containing protein [Acidobacteriota bacterium]